LTAFFDTCCCTSLKKMCHDGNTAIMPIHQSTFAEATSMDQEAASVTSCHQPEMSCLLSRLLEEERVSHESPDHLLLKRKDAGSTCTVWRERVAQWFDDVIHHLGEPRSTVYVAMNILDRYLVVKGIKNASSRCYEAASLTALFLAIRIRGSESLEVFDLISMSRLGVTIREILEIGKDITRSVSFERRLLTPSDFVKPMLKLLPCQKREEIVDEVFLKAELFVINDVIVGTKASTVAIASILEALGSDSSIFVSTLSSLSCETFCHKEIIAIQTQLRKLKERSKNLNKPNLILDSEDETEDSSPVLSQEMFGMKRTLSDCSTDSSIDLFTPTASSRPISPIPAAKKARIT